MTKHKIRKTTKTRKANKTSKSKHKKTTHKRLSNVLVLPNKTPHNIGEISKEISNDISDSAVSNDSYSPSINKELILLASVARKDVHNCNNSKAFLLEEPLKIGIPGLIYGKNCHSYNYYLQFLLC